MRGKARHHKRGSAIIMAVGLLVMMALLGTTFYVITHLDRKESQSLATAASIKNVATSVLDEICAALVADLYIDGSGVIYGGADSPGKTIDYPHENVDTLLASVNPEYTVAQGDFWRHVSNLRGNPTAGMVPVFDTGAPPKPGLWLVDTDGRPHLGQETSEWFFGDAIPFDSGLRDRLGRVFRVAVRVVDANAFLNANIHNLPSSAAAGKVMPITDVSLERLVGGAVLGDIHDVRAYDPASLYPNNVDPIDVYWKNYVLRPMNMASPYHPFDVSDMLAVSWYGYIPSTASGRLWKVWNELDLADAYFAARPLMTTHSACRIMVPRPGQSRYRADLNVSNLNPNPNKQADFEELFKAFYDMIPPGIPGLSDMDADRREKAAQMAVNVIDFSDRELNNAPEVVSVFDIPGGGGTKVFGIERQPFIVEAAYKREVTAIDPVTGAVTTEDYYAIELFNPYAGDIDMTGWKVYVGGAEVGTLDGVTISRYAGGDTGRLVIVNDDVNIEVTGGKKHIPALDLTKEVQVLRRASDTSLVVVGRVGPAHFAIDPGQLDLSAVGEIKECIRRRDRVPEAIYCLARFKNNIEIDITTANSNLGKDNGSSVPTDDPALEDPITHELPVAHPVYVRDNKFVNVSDLNRIFFVGPDVQQALDEKLSAGPAHELTNCRLNPMVIVPIAGYDPVNIPQHAENGPYNDKKIPAIPVGCMLADFFMVQSPRADGVNNDGDSTTDGDDNDGGEDVVYGQINLNTATESALHCLPGLEGLDDQVRTSLVQEIIAYRDLLDNTPNGGANYSLDRQHTSVGIANLRREPGFASPGEVAIPILLRAVKGDIPTGPGGWRLPQNDYSPSNAQPRNYTVSELDAGGNTVTTHDDGLSVADADKINNDLIKCLTYYSWLSNHVTVRSDVYIAYIRVDLRNASNTESLTTRKYVAVIDRSNCRSPSDRPTVLMFTHIR